MPGGRRILVTGVSGIWGAELARRLERHPDVDRVIGIDTKPPPADLETTEYIKADIRDPQVSELIPATEVDTVAHCGIVWYPESGKPARSLHDINVIGTLQLLAACEKTPTLRQVVVRGSAAIYGSEPAGPSFFTEELARRYPLRTRFQRDIGELEGYFDNFAHRHTEVACTMLRYQPEIGPNLDLPLCRYLSLPVIPTQLGFDPLLQLVHAEDATEALLAAVLRPVRGAVNVAPTGSISLTRIVRTVGRPALPLPHPLFGPALSSLGRRLGAADLSDDAVRLLRYGRGVDNSRLREEVGYEPRDAAATVQDFADNAPKPVIPNPGHLAGRARTKPARREGPRAMGGSASQRTGAGS